MSSDQSTSHARLPGLDTLRACAVLMVIPFHATSIVGRKFFGYLGTDVFRFGWIGVDLFFVLSGFLICSQLLQSVKRDGGVNFPRFYIKRSMRILPAYLTVLLLYYVWPEFREKPDMDGPLRFMLFYMNYGRNGEAYSHAWSLCVEEHFYLLIPMLIAGHVRWPKIFRPQVLIPGALIGVVGLRYYLWSIHAPYFPEVYRKSHTHLDGLTVGLTLAILREYKPVVWSKLTAKPWLLFVVGLTLVNFGKSQEVSDPVICIFSFTLVSLGFGALVATALTPSFWLARTKIPGAATVALLAFSLYLTHKQMIHMAKLMIDDYANHPWSFIGLSITLTALAAVILYACVERPFLRLRDRMLSRSA